MGRRWWRCDRASREFGLRTGKPAHSQVTGLLPGGRLSAPPAEPEAWSQEGLKGHGTEPDAPAELPHVRFPDVAFPLTPPSPAGRGRTQHRRGRVARRLDLPKRVIRCSLSPGERVRVRASRWAPATAASAGIVQFQESSGKAGGFPFEMGAPASWTAATLRRFHDPLRATPRPSPQNSFGVQRGNPPARTLLRRAKPGKSGLIRRGGQWTEVGDLDGDQLHRARRRELDGDF